MIAKTENSVADEMETMWIGTLVDFDILSDESERNILSHQLEELNCIPLLLDKRLHDMAYQVIIMIVINDDTLTNYLILTIIYFMVYRATVSLSCGLYAIM